MMMEDNRNTMALCSFSNKSLAKEASPFGNMKVHKINLMLFKHPGKLWIRRCKVKGNLQLATLNMSRNETYIEFVPVLR